MSKLEEIICPKCNEPKKRMVRSVYRTNIIYVDEKDRRWKSGKCCPDCFTKYNTAKSKQRRSRVRVQRVEALLSQ